MERERGRNKGGGRRGRGGTEGREKKKVKGEKVRDITMGFPYNKAKYYDYIHKHTVPQGMNAVDKLWHVTHVVNVSHYWIEYLCMGMEE